MQEVTTRWSSLSVFPGQHNVYSFLQECLTILHPGEISGYYINLGQRRGVHVTIFAENLTGGGELPSELRRRIDGFVARSRQEIRQRFPLGVHELFMDIPDGGMLRNWRRLRAEPFLYFSEQTQKLYYEILQLTTDLVIGHTQDSFEAIMRNKVSFCYNVILLILACIDNSDPTFWTATIGDILQKDLSDARVKLDRDPEPALQRTFDKNQAALMYAYKQIFEDKDVETHGAFKTFREGLAKLNMSSLISEVNAHGIDKPVSVLFGSLINDIYDTVGMDQGLACGYFLRTAFSISQTIKRLSDENCTC